MRQPKISVHAQDWRGLFYSGTAARFSAKDAGGHVLGWAPVKLEPGSAQRAQEAGLSLTLPPLGGHVVLREFGQDAWLCSVMISGSPVMPREGAAGDIVLTSLSVRVAPQGEHGRVLIPIYGTRHGEHWQTDPSAEFFLWRNMHEPVPFPARFWRTARFVVMPRTSTIAERRSAVALARAQYTFADRNVRGFGPRAISFTAYGLVDPRERQFVFTLARDVKIDTLGAPLGLFRPYLVATEAGEKGGAGIVFNPAHSGVSPLVGDVISERDCVALFHAETGAPLRPEDCYTDEGRLWFEYNLGRDRANRTGQMPWFSTPLGGDLVSPKRFDPASPSSPLHDALDKVRAIDVFHFWRSEDSAAYLGDPIARLREQVRAEDVRFCYALKGLRQTSASWRPQTLEHDLADTATADKRGLGGKIQRGEGGAMYRAAMGLMFGDEPLPSTWTQRVVAGARALIGLEPKGAAPEWIEWAEQRLELARRQTIRANGARYAGGVQRGPDGSAGGSDEGQPWRGIVVNGELQVFDDETREFPTWQAGMEALGLEAMLYRLRGSRTQYTHSDRELVAQLARTLYSQPSLFVESEDSTHQYGPPLYLDSTTSANASYWNGVGQSRPYYACAHLAVAYAATRDESFLFAMLTVGIQCPGFESKLARGFVAGFDDEARRHVEEYLAAQEATATP